jgi:lytic murein transglycosylase
MLFKSTVAAAAMLSFAATAQAETCGSSGKGFDRFIKEMKREADTAGVSAEAVSVLNTVKYDSSIIKKDRAQNHFAVDFLNFQAGKATVARINKGQAAIAKNQKLFDLIEQQFGVPAPVITAFWALETDFGGVMGDSPTIQSIATLAWDCRRPEKFRPQLIAALQLLDSGDIALEDMRGAWAGEIGHTQFMAYDYNESAVDFDGDGKRNLRTSAADALASAANLLRKHGWQPGQPWLQEVRVPDELPWEEADIAIQHPRKKWLAWGVTAVNGKPIKGDGLEASLLLPMGKDGPAFLAYENFTTAYLKWNESLIYSTTAAYLATRIAGAKVVSRGNAPVQPLSYEEIVQLQDALTAKGYDVGKSDGKIGAGTRAAVKAEQLKAGLPADSYPTAELLSRLQ